MTSRTFLFCEASPIGGASLFPDIHFPDYPNSKKREIKESFEKKSQNTDQQTNRPTEAMFFQ